MSYSNKNLGPSDHRSLAELEERHGFQLEGVHLPPCPPLHLLPRLRPPRQLSPARPLRPPRQVSGQGARGRAFQEENTSGGSVMNSATSSGLVATGGCSDH